MVRMEMSYTRGQHAHHMFSVVEMILIFCVWYSKFTVPHPPHTLKKQTPVPFSIKMDENAKSHNNNDSIMILKYIECDVQHGVPPVGVPLHEFKDS
jgi:hypothetical protein